MPEPIQLPSHQEAFNLAYFHFVVNEAPLSFRTIKGAFPGTTHTICAYRSEDGENRCAIGLLIPDDVYDPDFETNPADYLELDGLITADFNVAVFQHQLHDDFAVYHDSSKRYVDASTPATRRAAYFKYAQDYGLKIPT